MPIRFTKDVEAQVVRDVKLFNQKRSKAIKQGYKHVPPMITVAELKSRYDTKPQLMGELEHIRKFSTSKDAMKEVELSGGAKAIQWEIDDLKRNLQYAKDWLGREFSTVRGLMYKMPGERTRLSNVIAKRAILEQDIAMLDQRSFDTYKGVMDDFYNAGVKRDAGYRGFLSEVELVMRRIGVDEKTIDEFFDTINTLTPNQFMLLYENEELIKKVYSLADSPTFGGFKLNTDEKDAQETIDTMLEYKDERVKKGKRLEEEQNLEEVDMKLAEQEKPQYMSNEEWGKVLTFGWAGEKPQITKKQQKEQSKLLGQLFYGKTKQERTKAYKELKKKGL